MKQESLTIQAVGKIKEAQQLLCPHWFESPYFLPQNKVKWRQCNRCFKIEYIKKYK